MSRIKKIWDFLMSFTESISIYAAQASFFIIISAIPLMMLVFTLAKPILSINQFEIINKINSFMPAEISSFLTHVVNDLFDKTSSVPVISVSAISALWLASRGVMALNTGLSKVYEVQERNYFFSRLVSILYTLVFAAAIILTLILFAFGSRIEAAIINSHFMNYGIVRFLLKGRFIIVIIYLTLVFALAYTFMPKPNNKFIQQLPGAFIATISWIGFSYIYSIYIEHFSNYSFVYGSLTAIVFMMLWLYFCMNIFLYGAKINKMLKNKIFLNSTTT